MINNRQNGRRRGRGGGGNGQRPGGNPGRPDNGNRIDNRARGNANQLYEKYKNLARDAHQSGDRVNTEYYLQFADHYFRVLNETRSRSEDQTQRRPRDENYVNGFDNDFEGEDEYGDEGEPVRAGEQGGDQAAEQQEPRRDGQRDGSRDGQRDGQRRYAEGDRGFRGDQNRGRDRRDDERLPVQAQGGQPAMTPDAAVEGGEAFPSPEPVTARAPVTPEVANDVEGEAPTEGRRRGRPRRERTAATDETTVGIEADRLPPALSPVNDADEAEDAPKPRRRRTRAAQGEAPAA